MVPLFTDMEGEFGFGGHLFPERPRRSCNLAGVTPAW
ncbi:hypothetical protein SAMN05216225_107011 [Ornithinibacillus halophilus]|uniref:Uncharacterized protein n=1 Tax=Ornithinibacillus halophilus TaxID=930117 RepID=A0A1M5N4Y1_9BACI|nr:hypothetical protein SAMN05216225_107011 [Ornithinibacillus halophilus]